MYIYGAFEKLHWYRRTGRSGRQQERAGERQSRGLHEGPYHNVNCSHLILSCLKGERPTERARAWLKREVCCTEKWPEMDLYQISLYGIEAKYFGSIGIFFFFFCTVDEVFRFRYLTFFFFFIISEWISQRTVRLKKAPVNHFACLWLWLFYIM